MRRDSESGLDLDIFSLEARQIGQLAAHGHKNAIRILREHALDRAPRPALLFGKQSGQAAWASSGRLDTGRPPVRRSYLLDRPTAPPSFCCAAVDLCGARETDQCHDADHGADHRSDNNRSTSHFHCGSSSCFAFQEAYPKFCDIGRNGHIPGNANLPIGVPRFAISLPDPPVTYTREDNIPLGFLHGSPGQTRMGSASVLNCGGSEELPALKTGGLYKSNFVFALRFCRGLSVPCTSGRRGHVLFQIESLRPMYFRFGIWSFPQ